MYQNLKWSLRFITAATLGEHFISVLACAMGIEEQVSEVRIQYYGRLGTEQTSFHIHVSPTKIIFKSRFYSSTLAGTILIFSYTWPLCVYQACYPYVIPSWWHGRSCRASGLSIQPDIHCAI